MRYENRVKWIIHHLNNGRVFHARTALNDLIKELGYEQCDIINPDP